MLKLDPMITRERLLMVVITSPDLVRNALRESITGFFTSFRINFSMKMFAWNTDRTINYFVQFTVINARHVFSSINE
ncbi:hypothetical protein MSSAC_1016 [Methanosarcina siciliae C2J]|uniref:Uncharacterized protein n=1 Tax=Methanosarcina siciliae C2J TaxID=1434118 RepID=A0A0E3LCJ0_9EURY|nr:hypothetical protein MSSAC_1016 [Methanosarcina siciliae C2J]